MSRNETKYPKEFAQTDTGARIELEIMAQLPFAMVVVDPSTPHREGLVRILSSAGFNVVAGAASIAEVVHGLVEHRQSILLVLHVSSNQDPMVAQIQLFRKQHPAARIALLHDHGQLSNANIIAAFEAGIDAYFVEPSHSTLIKSLELVMQGNGMAVRAAFRRSKKSGHVVQVQSEKQGDAIPSPSDPSELAKRAAEAMNADLVDKAFAKKRHHRRSKRTLAGETDRQGATTAKTTHERDDKG